MAYQRRFQKDGSFYFSFVIYDPRRGTNVRFTKDEIRKRFGRDVKTELEAVEFEKLLRANHESESIKIQRRLEWQNRFYNFNDLLAQYELWQKKIAPRSYENSMVYLKHYVLRYFLTLKNIPNIDMWSDHFIEFKDWLEKDAFLMRSPKKLLAYNSKNHVISALNTFLTHLSERNYIAKLKLCPSFSEHLTNNRTLDDIVQPDEAVTIKQTLIAQGDILEAEFFSLLFFTGMRFHEGLGVSLADIFQGKLVDSLIGKALDNNNVEYYGYIVIDSQFEEVRKNGKIERAPLKGQKRISERNARTIPIIDKELWNALVDKSAILHKEFKHQKYGGDKKDYILFRGVNINTSSARLRKAFATAKLKHRSWHCLRHSRATFLIGVIKDTMVVRLWTGHKSLKVLERYNHIYQAIVRKARSNEVLGDEFGLKKV